MTLVRLYWAIPQARLFKFQHDEGTEIQTISLDFDHKALTRTFRFHHINQVLCIPDSCVIKSSNHISDPNTSFISRAALVDAFNQCIDRRTIDDHSNSRTASFLFRLRKVRQSAPNISLRHTRPVLAKCIDSDVAILCNGISYRGVNPDNFAFDIEQRATRVTTD